MSCRHSLATNTCKECYPVTGTIIPQGLGNSLDSPGAVGCAHKWQRLRRKIPVQRCRKCHDNRPIPESA